MDYNAKEKYFLVTFVNISEKNELNGEFENKLFHSSDKARDYLDKCVNIEVSAQKEKDSIESEIEIERIDNYEVNLWLNKNHSEAVLYRIEDIIPE